jgi:hypothetical protein
MDPLEDLNPDEKVEQLKKVEDAPLEGVITAEEIYELERSGITLKDVIQAIESRE